MQEYVVEMCDIVKDFPGLRANDHITLQLRKGEVHALLGENGAGKSTLMSILFGLYRPDSGRILVRGTEVHITNPNVAGGLGIGMVHQHFKLVHNFTVTENIVLGLEPRKGLSMDLKGASRKIADLSKRYGLDVDPDTVTENISVGMQQRVEILKMLYRDAEVLIFDEPTAVLTPMEIKELMRILRNLINEGKSIILITHKLKEIRAVADRCTVIRRGKLIDTVEVAETTEQRMAEMMVGRELSFEIEKQEQAHGASVLEVRNLSVKSHLGNLGLEDFSITVRAGEIVGIAGVDGNGQSELVEAITGLRRAESGEILLGGKDITHAAVAQRIEAGLSHIPEDRHKRGLVLEYSLEENMILEIYGKPPYAKHGFLQRAPIRDYAQKIFTDFDVRSGEGIYARAGSLSGGNQQKVIIGREIEKQPNLLIAVQPTRGLDVGSIQYIHKRIVQERDKGKAVLLVSLELEEVIQLSDRIVAINAGRKIDEVLAKETDENEVGLMMAGIRKGGEANEAKA